MDNIEDQFKLAAELYTHAKYEEAEALYAQGKYEEAVIIFKEVYIIQALPNVFGLEHNTTLTTQIHISETLIEMDKYDEGLEILTELEEIIESRCPGHEFAVIARKIKAEVYQHNEGVGRMHTIEDRIKEAKGLHEQGKYEETLKIFNEIYDIQKCSNVLGPDYMKTLTGQNTLVEILIEMKKYDEALKIVTEVDETKRKIMGIWLL